MPKHMHLPLLILLGSLVLAHAAEPVTGAWTLSTRGQPGTVHLTLVRTAERSSFSMGSDRPLADLQGLDLAAPGKHNVHFAIVRDAGRFDAEGFVSGSDGAGLFRFTPAARYAADMAALGFDGITPEKQLSFALRDISVAFAKDMRAARIDGLDTGALAAFHVHGVDRAYVAALRAAGLQALRADRLIAFRIHGVTPAFVGAVHKLGFKPSEKQFIAMRIHKVTPEYIAGLLAHGMKNLTVDQLIRLRIHNIA